MTDEGMPLVSVIIPTYKRNEQIGRAIESVCQQTYRPIEIIVVDDNDSESCYREKTKEKLRTYIENDVIRYIAHEQNQGAAAARNTGIQSARGQFIAFLDDDDVYHEEKIEKQYALFLKKQEEQIGMIYCYMKAVNVHGRQIDVYANDAQGHVLYESMLNCLAGTSAWFCPKDALLTVGGFDDAPSKEDSVMIFKLLQAGYSIYRVPEQLVDYYEYAENKLSGIGEKAIHGEIFVRNEARRMYSLLQDNRQVQHVEVAFAKKLLTLYILNNNRQQARRELATIRKYSDRSADRMKAMLKYCLPAVYRLFVHQLRKRRFQ